MGRDGKGKERKGELDVGSGGKGRGAKKGEVNDL